MMKLGLALSVVCLLGSVGFWASTFWAAPTSPGLEPTAKAAPFATPAPASWHPARLFEREESSPGLALGVPEQGQDQEEDLEEMDELEPPGPEEAALRGRVVFSGGELPEETVVVVMGEAAPSASEDQEQEEEEPDPDAHLEHEVAEVEEHQEVFDTGEFDFLLPPGNYRLVARAPGLAPATLQQIQVGPGQDLRGLVLELQPGLAIRGAVFSKGEPHAGLAVVVEGQGFRRTAHADDDGSFEVTGLIAGSYQVRAFDEEAGSDERQVYAGGQVSLELARRGRLYGRVVDERGFPVPFATVYGAPFAADEEEPDRDPHGVLDEYLGLHYSSCWPIPSCRELASADSGGAFVLEVAQGASLSLGAEAGEARGALEAVSTESPEVVISIHRVSPVRLKVTNEAGAPAQGRVSVNVPTSRFEFAGQSLQSGPDGVVLFKPWPGIPQGLRADAGRKLTALDPLPPATRIEHDRRKSRMEVDLAVLH